MKNTSQAYKNHKAQDTTTVCNLWKVVRTDNVIFGVTNHARDITYNGLNYSSKNSFNMSAIKTNSSLAVDNLELTGALGNIPTEVSDTDLTGFLRWTDADIQAGIWSNAYVELIEVNYEDLSMGHEFLKSGYIGQIKTGRNTYTAEQRGISQVLQQESGRLVTAKCLAKLGDSVCNYDGKTALNLITFNGSVIRLIDQHSWIDTSLNQSNSTYVKAIQSATKTNPIVITCNAHGLSSGEKVTFSGISGMTQLNGLTFDIIYINANQFSVITDGTIFNDYSSGGQITKTVVSEYFKDGVIEWLTGNNAGLKFDIKSYRTNFVQTHDAHIFPIQIGDTYIITAGCDKLISTCHQRFNNRINFYGFNLVPGRDRMVNGT